MLNVLAVQAPDHGTNYGYILVIVAVIVIGLLVSKRVSRWENERRAARRAKK